RGMKPAFALDFRNDAIALLHRSSGGWLLVGRVTLDEPDLPEALSYLRATALGLSPRGLATKLILPDDQLLVTTVDAPGPDEASRLAQIRTALEGRTPYAVDDLVFDWELIDGEVHVAVVARETLDEAESFASEHRFNPVVFAAAPSQGYVGEAFFGPTGQASTLLSGGETVERDAERTAIIDRSSLVEQDAVAVDTPIEASQPPEDEAKTAPAPQSTVPKPAASATDLEALEERDAATASAPVALAPEADRADAPGAQVTPRETPLFGLADDEAPPSAVFRALDEPEPKPEDAPAGDIDAFAKMGFGKPAQLTETDAHDPVSTQPDADEAPMAIDVEIDEAEEAKTDRAKDPAEPASDDVPPVPGYSATLGFASRRASADPGLNAKPQAAPPKPTVDRPTAARPLVAAPAPKAERPTLNRPTAARPIAPKESKGLRGLGAFVTAPGIPGTRKKPAEVAVPRPVAATPPAPQSASTTPSEATAGLGRKLGARPVVTRGKPRHLGLILTGLLLLVLAVVAAWSTSLAFRSDEGAATEFATPDPATALPAIEDEMLADGQDPDLLTDEELAATLPAPSEAAVANAQDPEIPATESDAAPATETATPGGTQVNPGTSSGDEIFLAAKDVAPVTPEATDLAAVSAQGDPLPNAQAPPPPFGTVYQFDANGMIVPTPEGIITPEGVMLIAGKPPRVSEPRPAGLVPPADTTATDDVAAFVSDPALAGFRPKARPAGLTPPPSEPAAEPTPGETTDTAPLDDAALPPAADSRLAGLRPLARPEAVLAAGEAARARAAAENSGSIWAMGQAQSAEEAAAAGNSNLAVSISRKPQPRPRDLSRAVEAAVAAAIRAPEPTQEPQEEQLASVRPAKTPEPSAAPEAESGAAKSVPRGRDGELDIYEEPEVEASATRGTASASVAKQATFRNALNLDKTALIGVYGTPSKRYAMVRSANGRYKKVTVGDRIDGGQIQAITATEVRYQKGSRLVTLSLPKG
ncbi:MAG: hypothetical protein ACO22Z_08795, partial [Paracoccaceae bacterium]